MHVNDCFVLRKVYGEALLMPIRRNEIVNELILLNEVACQIWESVEKNLSFEQIVINLRVLYELEEDSDEENSIRRFLFELVNMQLIFED